MDRLGILLNAYKNYDRIYLALILIAFWVAISGHLVTWILPGSKTILYIYWIMVILLYAIGIIFVGINFTQ
jgi:hypothetical protein